MKNRTLWALVMGGTLALSAGATAVFAQDAPATPPTVDEAAPAPLQWMGKGGRGGMEMWGGRGGMEMWGGRGGMEMWGGRGGMEMWGGRGNGYGDLGWHGELLANALGITEAELDTARQEAYTAVLAQAVEDGYITQAQVDKWSDQPSAGAFVLREWYDDAAADGFLAEALGISAEDLQAARDSALPAAVEAGLIEQEDANLMQAGKLIGEAVQTAKDEAIAEAVEQGLLTQEQAGAMTSGGRRGFGGLPLPGMGEWGGMRGEHSFGRHGGFDRSGDLP